MSGSFEFKNKCLCVCDTVCTLVAFEWKILWNAYFCLIDANEKKDDDDEEKTWHNNFKIACFMNGCHNYLAKLDFTNNNQHILLRKRKMSGGIKNAMKY